ncbi:MAG: MOSC domain-containing protein [Sandaracinaceae bacterium]
MRLGQIWIHPVKSLAGVRVDAADVDDRGLAHDRRFMVVGPDGRFLTQRTIPRMVSLGAHIEAGELRITHRESSLSVSLDAEGPAREVTVWQDVVSALDVGDEAARFLTDALGAPARLVRMPREVRRQVDLAHAREGDLVSFADGFPFLVVGDGSLGAMSAELGEEADVRRFRPNLVIDGAPAFAEDEWPRFRIGPITFHGSKACGRCSIVDVDPDRGLAAKGHLSTLARFRKRGGEVYFGQNCVHDGTGTLRVGDAVEVLEA